MGAADHYARPEVCHSCGPLENTCPDCGARFWQNENFSCCGKGRVHLRWQFAICDELRSLLSLKEFKDHIRQYNMAMSLASVGHTNLSLPGNCSFIMGGRPYHRISSSLRPDDGQPAKFAQIYLLDVEDASNARNLFQHQELNMDILSRLHAIMLSCNPWVQQLRSAADNCRRLVWRWDGEDVNDAMVIGAIVAESGFRREISFQSSGGTVRYISDIHRLYHPLAYPILFPSGQTGWYLGMKGDDGSAITRLEYLRFIMMHRNEVAHIHNCGRLSLEFFCDAWASHEAAIMEFHRRPQQQVLYRSSHRAALHDQLGHADAHDIGLPVRTVLPSSVVGSPRFYHTLFLNAMALPRRFGKPDIFLTMTANPYWEEISAAIPAGSHWLYHPDIVARVFMLKVDALMQDIRVRKIFGEVNAVVYRIEWQKRGLPHLHCLIILQNHVMSVSHIDAIVSAEIPDPDADPALHAFVAHFMLHKPCDSCVSAGCRSKNEDGKCYRFFPKAMAQATILDDNHFPIYRRRGRFVTQVKDYNNNMRLVTDEWVVPYSPFLLLRYQCHLNVEISAHVKCFKYLYKYVLKPPDSAAIVIDEIDAYINGRMLSASEAVWRILGLRLHCEWPPVLCLDIHLPNHERMVFDPTMSVAELMTMPAAGDTMLTAWFKLNANDQSARQWLYTDITEHYVWDKTGKCWRKRKQTSIAIARTYAVSPRNQELYALRLLLNVVRGAVSWFDLLHVDGFICNTFHEACLARGLMNSDDSHFAAFAEIVNNTVCRHRIRQLFAVFLLNVQIADPVTFFYWFEADMCAENENSQVALQEIDAYLRTMNSGITAFGFPACDDNLHADDINHQDADADSMIHSADDFADQYELCSGEQQNAVDRVMEALVRGVDVSNVFVLQGGAGTGKTKWIQCIAAGAHHHRKKILCVASSALAASLLPRGRTAHAAFGIPVPVHENSFCNIHPQERRQMRNVDIVIWDEMSMIHFETANCVDHSLRDIFNCDRPFGGVIFIFVGDFKQLPPVVRRGRGEYATIHRCSWWSSANQMKFSVNWRASDNVQFTEELYRIGSGALAVVDVPLQSLCGNVQSLIDSVFGDNVTDVSNDSSMILSLKLDEASIINNAVMDMIPGEETKMFASDQMPDNAYNLPSEYVASLQIPGRAVMKTVMMRHLASSDICAGAPPFELKLKIGARYMVMKNFDHGIVNGTLCKLVGYSAHLLHVQLLTGQKRMSVVMLPKCSFQVLSGVHFS